MNDLVLPATRYALSGDVSIAYQVMGRSPNAPTRMMSSGGGVGFRSIVQTAGRRRRKQTTNKQSSCVMLIYDGAVHGPGYRSYSALCGEAPKAEQGAKAQLGAQQAGEGNETHKGAALEKTKRTVG
jgi:hypothetical protein